MVPCQNTILLKLKAKLTWSLWSTNSFQKFKVIFIILTVLSFWQFHKILTLLINLLTNEVFIINLSLNVANIWATWSTNTSHLPIWNHVRFQTHLAYCIIQKGYVWVSLTGVPYMPINVNTLSMQVTVNWQRG